MVLLIAASSAPAQEARPVTVPSGVPLRVALERRVPIKRVGEPIQARLVESVYVYDRVALPAGGVVEGHIAEIGGVPAGRRITALLSGNFTPPREVRAQFDALLLSDGSRLPIHTSLARGTAHTMRVAKPGKKQERQSVLQRGRDRLAEKTDPAILAFKAPGRMSRLKSTLLGMLPYHRQAWAAGTLFNGVLQEPLAVPVQAGGAAVFEPEAEEVTARLLTPIDSATARRGAPVEALVTRPVFSPDHTLRIPEGSHLLGDVVESRPARFLHRNGMLHFVFRQIRLPQGATQSIQGYLEGVEADFEAHLALDSEGAARVSSPKTRFIFPAIAVAAAGLSFHQDYNAQGVPDQDIGGRAESGAVGLGLVGTLVAQASRTVASSIAITGAAFSLYSNFIARGKNVNLPASTPVKVSLKERGAQPVR